MVGWGRKHQAIRFVRWLETVLQIKHRIDVIRTTRLYGYFDAPKTDADRPYMVIVDDDVVLITIAHEMVHYEQWRDKRELDERGVEQRARALVRQWRRESVA